MRMTIKAACGCHKGRIRSNNEDNLYFNGKTLEQENDGLRHPMADTFRMGNSSCFAIFDGMGGEEAGEIAAYLAAQTMEAYLESKKGFMISPKELLNNVCDEMNKKVCEASAKLEGGRMGSTVASLLFTDDEVYVCNIGDSRVFRLRDDELLQLSKDHVERLPVGMDERRHKPRLTQHLGIFPDELTLEPYIAKGEVYRGDRYLICSDGLTDMLTNVEICALLKDEDKVKRCVEALIQQALQNGGKDNVSVILCEIR